MLGGAIVVLLAWYAFGTTCDDACDPRSGGWDDDPDAWQWDAQFAFATAAVATAIGGSLLMVMDRRDRVGPGLFFAGVGAALVWLAWFASAY